MNTHKPDISVVIPTFNERGFIENILSDLVKQGGYREIIISDSGSTDATGESVKKFIKEHPSHSIKFLGAPRKGTAVARNYGAHHASGTYLVFLDADSRISDQFIQNVLEEMETKKLDCGGCFLETLSTRLFDRIMFLIQKYIFHSLLQYTKRPGAAGAGIVIKKAHHEKIQGFDETMEFGEDLDYVKRASRTGFFRMIKSTHVIFSMRRFEKEGRLAVWYKYFKGGISYFFNIKTCKVTYEFGKFGKEAISEGKKSI